MNLLKLFAVVRKELLLLWRDRAGLALLFVMPALLVVIITLVQENVLKVMGESSITILIVDEDDSAAAEEIKTQLADLGNVSLIEEINGNRLTKERAVDLISRGKYQFGVVLPEGLAESINKNAVKVVENILNPDSTAAIDGNDRTKEIELFFDPAVRGGFRKAVLTSLNRVLFTLEIKERLSILAKRIPERISSSAPPSLSLMAPEISSAQLPDFDFQNISEPTFKVEEKFAARSGYEKLPTSVQQNVPAWSLFGIFFIAVPLAGSLLHERDGGTLTRLRSMPVSLSTLIGGKIVAYQMVCFGQFFLIAAIGKYLMPALGTPAFEPGGQYGAMALLVFASSLAAAGYGVLLGSVSRTFEQASMFGPISVVAAAAIGGVMVPVFAMPEFMRKISIVSPLNWGLEGFMDIFVRGGSLADVLPEASLFLAFFMITAAVSLAFLQRKT